jgi:hypothetical protein
VLRYVVRRLFDVKEGDALHAAFRGSQFSLSPRYGAKPQHGRTAVLMSFFKRVGPRAYSLGIRMDVEKQTIEVTSFELGTKYDRLM